MIVLNWEKLLLFIENFQMIEILLKIYLYRIQSFWKSFQFLLQFFYTEIICILNHHSHIVKYLRLKFLNYQ